MARPARRCSRSSKRKGITGLAYWDNGFKVMSANKPMKLPADVKGQKMRIQSSQVLAAQMKALGALPQTMAFSEVYQALQTGVVDGTENPPSNLYTQKMHEVQKHVTMTNHGYLGYAVITNKKFWDGLPPDVRAGLEAAMAEATVYANQIAKQENEDAMAKVKASGKSAVYTPTRRGARRVEEGAGHRCTRTWKAGSARTRSRPCTRKPVSSLTDQR